MASAELASGTRAADSDLRARFACQVDLLVGKGYPALAGLTADAFAESLAPLTRHLPEPSDESPFPFVIVFPSVAPEQAMELVELGGAHGYTGMEAADLEAFEPIEGVPLPDGVAYLVTDLDPGRATLNVTPNDALGVLADAGRSPLTIAEGIALVTQHPSVLAEQNCFSLLGSRCGDRRVTALWLSGGRPRLGWCWAGNPHTWLGSASCAARVGA